MESSANKQTATRFSPLNRPASPTRINVSLPSSLKFFTLNKNPNTIPSQKPVPKTPKRTCMCSPTTHPGSFRCKLHRKNAKDENNSSSRYMQNGSDSSCYSNNRLNARRSAMVNSLVRIGTVEGDLMRRALASLIRPSSHQQKRRNDFRPKKSRLSVMVRADDL